jgi:hypothetical protein
MGEKQMIKVLLFLRAWHAELRLFKYGMRSALGMSAPSAEVLERMSKTVNQRWIDYSVGYPDIW